ncbi:MAG TPA: tetratricopeptide repeat protein [Anaeromyxobacteraceae bacterium]|nr:tetratricopeptide repeat protein [Anaeromyxobacteraceae bacterium]
MAVDKNKLIAEATKFVQKGQWDKAITVYERIVAEDPRDVRVLLKIGELQQKKDDLGAAATTMHSVAEVYTEQGFFLKAVAVYKQIVRLTPDDVRVNERLAVLYQQLGIMSDAMAQLQLVAAAAERVGDDKRLAEVLRRMTDLDPENPAPAARLGEILARQGDAKGALELLHRSAEGLKKANRLDEYVRVAERIAALEPANVALGRELARLYLARGDTRRALAKLQLCFKSEPDDIDTLNLLAQAFRELGQVSKTVSVYKELARIHGERGRAEESRATWKRVLDLAPDDPDALDALEPGALTEEPAPASAFGPASAAEEPQPEAARRTEAPAARPIPPRPPPEIPAVPPPPPPPVGPEAIPKLITETDVYLKYGLHAKAAEHLDKVFAIDADHVDARERARDLRAAVGDLAGAVEHGAKVVRTALRQGDTARARAGFDRLVALAPRDAEVAKLRDEVAGETGALPDTSAAELEEPLDGADVLVEVEPDDGGTQELQLGEQTQPPQLEHGVAVPGAGAGSGAVDLGDELAEIDFYISQGLHDEAREALTSLRALYPDESSLSEREGELARAIEAAGTGRDAAAGGAAEAAADERAAANPQAELHYSVSDALQQFRKGIEEQIRPEDAETHFDLGIAYKEMGLLDEALRELEVALAARPGRKEIDALTMIGLCRMQKGDAAGAIGAYRAALASVHATPEATLALEYELAMAYRTLGDVDAALWFLNKVLREDPGFRDVRGQVAAMGDGEGRPPPDDSEAAGAPVAASS